MSMSLFSARTMVAGVVGAGAVSAAMLFGAMPLAQAASAPAPTPTVAQDNSGHVVLAGIHHHHRHDRNHSINVL